MESATQEPPGIDIEVILGVFADLSGGGGPRDGPDDEQPSQGGQWGSPATHGSARLHADMLAT